MGAQNRTNRTNRVSPHRLTLYADSLISQMFMIKGQDGNYEVPRYSMRFSSSLNPTNLHHNNSASLQVYVRGSWRSTRILSFMSNSIILSWPLSWLLCSFVLFLDELLSVRESAEQCINNFYIGISLFLMSCVRVIPRPICCSDSDSFTEQHFHFSSQI